MNARTCILVIAICFGTFDAERGFADSPLKVIRPNATTGSAAAVISSAPRLLLTSQIQPMDGQGRAVGGTDTAKQIAQLFHNLNSVLSNSGVRLDDVVKLNFYVTRDDLVKKVQEALAKHFTPSHSPAVSYVTTRLPNPEALVAVDAIVALGQGVPSSSTLQMIGQPQTTVVTTETVFFISGQAEKASDLSEATRKTLLSLETSLKFCGRSKRDIRQIKCFLTPMSKVAEVELEIKSFCDGIPIPAVSYVEWQSTLPIEIEVIADGTPENGLVPTGALVYLAPPGLPASPVFSRICRIHKQPLIFVSGLHGAAGSNGTQQVEALFHDLNQILQESGSDLKHLVKATYYVSQDEPSQKLNELRPRYYDPMSPPAASKAQVMGVGKAGTGITLDMIAVPKF